MSLAEQVAAIHPWYHSIELAPGVVTPGVSDPALSKVQADIYFEPGVAGLSVLDIGAWDGYFSFEAERRGASRVLAVDHFCWVAGGPGKREAFELAHKTLGSKVKSRLIDIPDLSVDTVGRFDIVLFNGIFYHLENPLSALRSAIDIARYYITVESHLDLLTLGRPAMVYYPGENVGDKHGWGPNPLLLRALLHDMGCVDVLEFDTRFHAERRIYLGFKANHPFRAFVETFSARRC
jgi:tRNA (mo5U34)-methyltransferase